MGDPAKLSSSCHRCGAVLEPACPCCVATPPSVPKPFRFKLRTFLLLVPLFANASLWGVHLWSVQQADDHGGFYSHEEMVSYQGFLESVALSDAKEAEQKAEQGDRQRWLEEAARCRAIAAAHARSQADHRWRAELKKQLRQGGW